MSSRKGWGGEVRGGERRYESGRESGNRSEHGMCICCIGKGKLANVRVEIEAGCGEREHAPNAAGRVGRFAVVGWRAVHHSKIEGLARLGAPQALLCWLVEV